MIEQISNNSNQQQNLKLFQTIFSKQDLIHSLIPVAKMSYLNYQWIFEKFETFLVDVNNKFIALCEQQPSQEREFSLLVKV
nr:CMF_HP1_G0006510.mRNA.1.CDS.1 [Saccharomyces cerevisiae]